MTRWKTGDVVFGPCWDFEYNYPHVRLFWRYWTHKKRELRGTSIDINLETVTEDFVTNTKYMYKSMQNALFEIIARRDK